MLKRIAVILFLILQPVAMSADLEKDAGQWKPWVAGKINVPPPPDRKRTLQELAEVRGAQRHLDAALSQSIRYWDAGAPGYRWNEIAYDVSKDSDVPTERVYALVNVAVYDATIAAWRAKYEYRRQRPYDLSSGVKPIATPSNSPSYPSEHAAAAAAAAAVLGHLFPEKAAALEARALDAGRSRVAGGVQYPSDVSAGLELGRRVAAGVIAWAKSDGSEQAWQGAVPSGAGLWNGTKPLNPAIAKWRTWILTSPDQFRPPAPPVFGKEAMAEVADPKINTGSNRRAAYAWAVVNSAKYWLDETSLKLFEQKLDRNPPRVARVYAVLSTAYYDALIACWDAKYAYWGIRPNQLDPAFKPLFPTPNFPGYPSGHATFGGTAATVLSGLFPDDAALFAAKAQEEASSRLWAGIHFRIDNEVGLELGRAVGRAALARDRGAP